MNLILKLLLLPLLLVLTALPIHAEEDKWIDGIKFRYGELNNDVAFKFGGFEPGFTIIEVNNTFSHLAATPMFPIAITLPETLMNSWSFRGAFLEYQPLTVAKDLVPYGTTVTPDTTYLRQLSSLRTSLYNNFFSASDKSFADANSNWALSADVTSSRVFLGYYWGVFIPAFEYHRFAKMGLGLGAFYGSLSYKLNLCSQYKITPNNTPGLDAGSRRGHGGACVGKTEIDSSSYKGFGLTVNGSFTIWERVTKDSVWKIMTGAGGTLLNDLELKFKNHSKNLGSKIEIGSLEFISYTYRF